MKLYRYNGWKITCNGKENGYWVNLTPWHGAKYVEQKARTEQPTTFNSELSRGNSVPPHWSPLPFFDKTMSRMRVDCNKWPHRCHVICHPHPIPHQEKLHESSTPRSCAMNENRKPVCTSHRFTVRMRYKVYDTVNLWYQCDTNPHPCGQNSVI